MTVVCLTDEIVERQLRREGTLAPLLFKAFADQIERERARRAARREQATLAVDRAPPAPPPSVGAVRLNRETEGMCCFLLALFAFGPRVVLALEWIFGQRIQHAFAHWWWPLLGLIFLPWTTLMYTLVWSAGGVHGANWIAVGLGVFLDLVSYAGRQGQKMYGRRGAAY